MASTSFSCPKPKGMPFTLIGALLLLAAVHTFSERLDFLQTAKFASGQVSSLEASGSQPRINFTDDQGNAVSYAQDGFVFGYQRGMPVGVHYRPEAPVSSAVIDDAGAIWGSTLLLGLLGASMTLAGMPTLRVRRWA